MKVSAWLLALGVILMQPGRAAGADEAEAEVMRPTEVNGYELVEAEYLPFTGSATFHYPADALFGFYPRQASPAARQCALTTFKQILNFFFDNCFTLREASELGSSRRFIMRIVDYSQSNLRPYYRPAHFSHTGGVRPDYKQGAWMWSATLLPNGSCQEPNYLQMLNELNAAVAALSK